MSRPRYEVEEAKKISTMDVVEALGIEVKGKDARCPAHNDTGRPNMHVYEDNVHCFACGFSADNIGLVEKVNGLDFGAAVDFLGDRFGLPLIQDYRKKGSKTGRRRRKDGSPVEPPSAPLPDPVNGKRPRGKPAAGSEAETNVERGMTVPAPVDWATLAGQGYLGNGPRAKAGDKFYNPRNDSRPPLPVDRWVFGLDGLGEARRLQLQMAKEYVVEVGRDGAGFYVTSPTIHVLDRPRAQLVDNVFAALLEFTVPASSTPAGTWLEDNKGILKATQDRFGLRWLKDAGEARGALIGRYGVDKLKEVGLLTKEKEYFVFTRHRLLFPFNLRGDVFDIQGRDVEAKDKNRRFINTSSRNPIPYNADDIAQARELGLPVFLCEGASDTLTLAQSGRLVAGIVGTGGFKSAWAKYFDGLEVYIAFDGDEAGRKAAQNVAGIFVDQGLQAPKIVPIPDGQDVTELFTV